MVESIIDAVTVQAYRETDYRVHGDEPLSLRVGEFCPALAAAHKRHRVDCSAFITACNPFSKIADDQVNSERHAALGLELCQRSLTSIKGNGQQQFRTEVGHDGKKAMKSETVEGVPGLYVRHGKRKSQYFAQINRQYTALGTDRKEAERQLCKLLEIPFGPNTIAAMGASYIAEQRELLAAKDEMALSVGTIDDYETCLLKRINPIFGAMTPKEFQPMHGSQYLARRRKGDAANGIKPAPTRANREMAALSSAFNHGMQQGLVAANPCRGVKRNKEKPRQRSVGVAELNAFLQHAKTKGGSAYLVALIGCCVALVGRRRAEILALPKSALTAEGFEVKAAKKKPGEADIFYLVGWSPTLRQVINEVGTIKRRVSSIYLFATLDGQAYTDKGFKCLWNRLMHSYAPGGTESAEWFHAHDLRALYVSEMLEQGRDPNTHKNQETMRRVYDRRRSIKVTPLA